jgi:peptidylprolyl isomerase
MKALSIMLLIAMLAGLTVLTACGGGTQTVKIGDNVSVLYNGTLDDGTVFDASNLHGNVPLHFTVGDHKVISGFEQAVIGMSVNQSKTVHIPFADAYGPHYDNRTTTLNWSQFQNSSKPTVGEVLSVHNTYGMLNGTVLNVSDEGVTVDANIRLAGNNLNFEITLVEIVKNK